MHNQKRLVIVTLIISIILLFMYIIVDDEKTNQAILACAGSSILGFIMSLSSYSTEKKSTMRRFYQEAQRAYDVAFNLNMTDLQSILKFSPVVRNIAIENTHDSFDNLDGSYEEGYLNMVFADKSFEDIMEAAKEDVETTIQRYKAFKDYNLQYLENECESMDFLFSGKEKEIATRFTNTAKELQELIGTGLHSGHTTRTWIYALLHEHNNIETLLRMIKIIKIEQKLFTVKKHSTHKEVKSLYVSELYDLKEKFRSYMK